MEDLSYLDQVNYDAEEQKRREELAQYITVDAPEDEQESDNSGHVRSSSDEQQSENGGASSHRSTGGLSEPSSATKEEYLLGEDKYGSSYLDDYEKQLETQKKTGYRDSTRWGKSADQMFDEQKLNLGSYLDTHERMQQVNKNTTFSDQTRWGKSGELYDETKFQFGSYLEQQQRAERERSERESRLKAEAVAQLKKDQYLDPDDNIFKYEQLKGQFPNGVDPVRKEEYLSDEEFEKVFGMSYDDYMKLGAFKRKQLKKKVGLF